jgi:hypothetical protein
VPGLDDDYDDDIECVDCGSELLPDEAIMTDDGPVCSTCHVDRDGDE